ncbi:prophage tail fiber N-terminal domain-containing protein, partial [Salmonella enterica]|nr:prophage tail fiber N-terminal domain-containing protein [Salmonella enterica]
MATIKGILRDELGNTISGCLLTFIEQKTLRRFQVITQSGDKHGSYCLVLPVGIFRVLLKPDRSFERDLGEITVYSDSPDGTLNSFLNAKNSDTRPEALRQFDALVQRAETAADTSGSGADSAAASAAVAGQYAEAAKTHAKQAAASEEAAGGYA